MNKILIFFAMTFIINCRDNDRQFDWVNNLPHAWKLSESEFGGYLAQFQNRYPDYADRLKALNLWRVGTPYGLYCLGEEKGEDNDPIIRNDSSDCTVHMLTTLAFAESYDWKSARNAILDIHYKAGSNNKKEATFKSRWHFTADRLLNHDRTIDITKSLAESGNLEIVEIELNKKEDGEEFLDLKWTLKDSISFIPMENLNKTIISKAPSVCGIAFVKRSYFKMGIMIAHEGFLIDRSRLVHASSEFGETVNVDFFDYIKKNNEYRFDGVMLFKIEPK
tara:strand:+ start:512 stop:1345 length:834 start_codon:yes stop_codon:yes gene_type:complete